MELLEFTVAANAQFFTYTMGVSLKIKLKIKAALFDYQIRKKTFQEKVQLADKKTAFILVVSFTAKHCEQDFQFGHLRWILGHFHNSFNDLLKKTIKFTKIDLRSDIRHKHQSNYRALSACCLPSMGHCRQERNWQRIR